MNVIIANKYKEMLMSLDIEVIKSIEGEFEVDEIINSFTNFYFDRMILDITAIKDYQNLDNLQKLSINFDMNKVILLLDDSEESSSQSYLSRLISMGIYNFTRNSEGIKYLLENPNSYRDVAHLQSLNTESGQCIEDGNVTRIIGIKNLTEGAGATTFTYILKKHLENNYNVCAIEVDKRDFNFFDSKEMYSINSSDLAKELMKKRGYNVILIDLNGFDDPDICTDILYLVEPTRIKLNKLLLKDRNVFEKHKKDKIVLNKSNISDNEISEFEFETKSKVYFNIPNLDERKDYSREVNTLLSKLGFVKQNSGVESEDNKNKILGMFKF